MFAKDQTFLRAGCWMYPWIMFKRVRLGKESSNCNIPWAGHIDILRIIDYLSQLMYKWSILAAMSAARQQVDQYTAMVYWRAGLYEMGHGILSVLDGRPGGPGQVW